MRAVLAGIAICLAGAAAAQSVNCTAPSSQYEMTECAARDLDRADADLNRAYQRAIAAARAQGIEPQLRAAQRLWIPYRDAACEAEAAQFAGGTIRPQVAYTCLARLTRARTEDLYQFNY